VEIVFCKTRADPEFYRSYTDFWSLVELAGFPWIWLDELEPGRDAVYIVTPRNGELPGVLPRLQGNRACKFVWWCLERPDEQGSVTRGQPLEDGIDELWLSDRWLAERHGIEWGPSRFVPLGSHEGLGEPGADGYRYDWTHMSYINPRRSGVYSSVPGRVLPNCWNEVRDEGLRATRLMLNVHQDDWPIIEPLRWALAAAYGLTLVTERVHDPYPLRPNIDMVWDDYDGLSRMMSWLLEHSLFGCGPSLRRRLTQEFEFGRCVKEAVACLG